MHSQRALGILLHAATFTFDCYTAALRKMQAMLLRLMKRPSYLILAHADPLIPRSPPDRRLEVKTPYDSYGAGAVALDAGPREEYGLTIYAP